MPRVLIGAAHTLENPGQIFQDLKEADLTRSILTKVIPFLEKENIEFKTVPLDLPLLNRIEWINQSGYSEENGDIFVEIHINDGGKRGIESWYRGSKADDNKSQKLAEKLNEEICKSTGYPNQGAKSELEHELGSLLILNQINLIGTTIELLYIDNEEDIKILKDESQLENLAKTLVDAIKAYLESIPTNNTETTQQPQVQQKEPFGSPNSSLFGRNFPLFGQGGKDNTFQTQRSGNMLLDREGRKKIIQDTYKSIFDEEPSANDLNMYLNMGTSKEELMQKLIDSEQFKKIRDNSKKFEELNQEHNKLKIVEAELRSRDKDHEETMENFKKLLHHKNTYIAQLQDELRGSNIWKDGQLGSSQLTPTTETASKVGPQKKFSLTKLIMKILRI